MSDVLAKRKANNKGNPYQADGTPGDAFCKPGEYPVKDGKYYDAKNGPDRWDASMRKKGGY